MTTKAKKKRQPGQRIRLRDFLLANVGKVFDSETLRKIAGVRQTTNWSRRLRELRDKDGLTVLTHNDRSDLKPGQYVLPHAKSVPVIKRTVSKKLRAFILDRNGFTCQSCGAAAGEIHPFNSRPTRLHIGHIKDVSMGGSDDPSNLIAQCSVCNEGAANITLNRPDSDKLKAQVRRSPRDDQHRVMEWLVLKFPKEAENILKSRKN